jgi:Family of unknown function (DUF5681)
VNTGGTPRNLKPFKKGQSGNPRGRPKEPWREWLASDRVEPHLRELLLLFANDRRVKVETRVRIIEFVLNHAHGRPKETVEMAQDGPQYPDMDIPVLQRMLEMRQRALTQKGVSSERGKTKPSVTT